ncbi:MAG TPA: response regulator [Candidatus Methylomirabilis sp.]|nr:response regulator [Candidatus Methylomirabilis sp.]
MARKRVLIVDDETESRTLLRELFGTGYEICEATDGTEGLARAEQFRPDVILLDVRMPGLDGYEVCRGLKGNPELKAIPVIMVTAVEDTTLNRLAFQAGAAACLTKPVRQEALVTLIEAVTPKAKGSEDEP